jgi:hypothetical protein
MSVLLVRRARLAASGRARSLIPRRALVPERRRA